MTSLGNRAGLGDHLQVRLLVEYVGGSLAESSVILHEEDERDLLTPDLLIFVGIIPISRNTSQLPRKHLRGMSANPYRFGE
jgi:hypothetical protein